MTEKLSDDEDVDAWYRYPQYRKWFNKLYVADHLGYLCGPCGVPVPKSGDYVVRPIYNLAGMGVGAKIIYITPEDIATVPPGNFWVERFVGTHYSVDFVRKDGKFEQLNCYIGVNNPDNLSRFYSWTRSDHKFILPESIANIDVPRLNIEAIGDKIIEVHLRNGFDHMMQYESIIPVFENQYKKDMPGYTYIDGEADGYGWLINKRLGYFVK